MKPSDLTVPEISTLLADRIADLAPALLSGGCRVGAEWAASDITGAAPRTGGSLRVSLTGRFQGHWRDHATDEGGDPIDLIGATQGLDKGSAIRWGLHWLGLDGNTPVTRPRPRPAKPTMASPSRRAAKGAAIWKEARPITGTLAEAYLRDRGITVPLPPSLRFHPGLAYWDTAYQKPVLVAEFPALVSAIAVWPSREVTAVQCVFLNPETARKASVGCPKKTFGPAAGGAVRLAAHGPRLAISEGVETGLSVLQSCPGLPVWATLGTAGFLNLIIPPGVTDLTIAADAGKPGEIAAQKAARRFAREVSRVTIARPPSGHDDFNDVLTRSAREGGG